MVGAFQKKEGELHRGFSPPPLSLCAERRGSFSSVFLCVPFCAAPIFLTSSSFPLSLFLFFSVCLVFPILLLLRLPCVERGGGNEGRGWMDGGRRMMDFGAANNPFPSWSSRRGFLLLYWQSSVWLCPPLCLGVSVDPLAAEFQCRRGR